MDFELFNPKPKIQNFFCAVVFTIDVSIFAIDSDSVKRGSTSVLEIVSLSRISLSQ